MQTHTRRRLVSMVIAATSLVVALPAVAPATAATCSYKGAAANSVRPGQSLAAGQLVSSPNGQFAFGMVGDGTLALRQSSTGARRWVKAAGLGASFVYGATGDVTLRTSGGKVVWRGLSTSSCGEAVVEDTGRVAIYSGGSLVSTIPNSAGSGRDPAQYPFVAVAPWNSGIGSSAKFDPATGSESKAFLSGQSNVNSARWSVAVYRATTTDPMATVKDLNKGGTYTLRIPTNATATAGTDKHVAIVDPSGKVGYEFYDFSKVSNKSWTTTRVTITDLTKDGLSGGSRASNISLFAGLIRTAELKNDAINHALALAIPNTMLKSGPVWPATMQDSDGAKAYSGTIPMGSMVAIPSNVDLSKLGLTPEGLALGRALQNYGGYVLLRSSTVALYAELSADSTQVQKLRDAWYKLYPLTRVVTNSTPTTIGGGGIQVQATLASLR